ncbi:MULTISPECIES: DUF6602 domain-containing protein [Lysinibacillus]|uniref:DUF6602 domain-containing protein n=1 Tax=Lysinibacillus fusiformis TaxID=28031 RepID=A0A1E4R7A7_9BACI|nr:MULTISPECIES: DUF6602 domain-containing protein [Lysinibacillus]ODV56329.1 hypothetical protein BG258_10660 [Lysinibacillus fusiformis]
MDVKTIFRNISKQLISDFDISAQINHSGIKGTYREDTLKKFLLNGRIPKRFSIGSGEIIGPNHDVSKQCDLIFYDGDNCPVLMFGDSFHVYPAESVFGIIEIKSSLGKKELTDALANVAAFKSMVPFDSNATRPFGIIFAYSLSSNSLDSLEKNLKEYESKNVTDLWPNMVVVLNEGIIYHKNRFNNVFKSEEFNDLSYLISIKFKEDTLLEFYLSLFDLLSSKINAPLNLRKYKELPTKLGSYYVTDHDRFVDSENGLVLSIKECFIEKIYTYCKAIGKRLYSEILLLELGGLPENTNIEDFNHQIYYYDPDNLPGLHEVENPIVMLEKGCVTSEKLKVPSHTITINGERFTFPMAYLSEEDFEVQIGKCINDL